MKDARKVCHNSEETSLRNALVAYENAVIAMTLGGRPSTPRELARLCVIREKGCYMGDYIQDEKGKLKEIRFDKVKES